jgi:hypothetical protein
MTLFSKLFFFCLQSNSEYHRLLSVLKHHVDFLDLGQRCVVFMSKPAQHDMFFSILQVAVWIQVEEGTNIHDRCFL